MTTASRVGNNGSSGGSSGMDSYTLEIDPDPALVATARMFAATVARQLGLPDDSVLDVKLAVSEACTSALQRAADGGSGSPIRLTVEGDAADLAYEIVHGEGFADDGEGDPHTVLLESDVEGDPSVGIALIRTLFPTTEVRSTPSGTSLRFRVAR